MPRRPCRDALAGRSGRTGGGAEWPREELARGVGGRRGARERGADGDQRGAIISTRGGGGGRGGGAVVEAAADVSKAEEGACGKRGGRRGGCWLGHAGAVGRVFGWGWECEGEGEGEWEREGGCGSRCGNGRGSGRGSGRGRWTCPDGRLRYSTSHVPKSRATGMTGDAVDRRP